jgi:predicted RNase H-like nuclease
MNSSKYIGVDGCKAGWFFVAIGPGDELELGIFEPIVIKKDKL